MGGRVLKSRKRSKRESRKKQEQRCCSSKFAQALVMMVTQVPVCSAPHLLQAGSTVQMSTLVLPEASRTPHDFQAVRHIFLASDLILTSKACLGIGSHVL